MKPKITVLMPVYNCEKYIKRAVESILNQTFKNFEFLIINDGSIDKTKEIINSFTDPRIKLINNPKNKGIVYSLNIGLKLANADYIARMDADDISDRNRLQIQYNILVNNKDIGLVSSWCQLIDEDGKKLWVYKPVLNYEDIYYLLNFRNCIIHSSVMFRKELVINLKGYNKTFLHIEDYELWFRISKVTKIYMLPRILIKLRQTKNSISQVYKKIQEQNTAKLTKKNLEILSDLKLKNKDVISLQKDDINRLSEIKQLIYLIKIIKKNLLIKEDKIIKHIKLNKREIEKSMNRQIIRLFKLYLKNNLMKLSFMKLIKKSN